jgi:peptidoglycan/xylan/chitin deacetylase (PgdA/CDA1 family)
MLSVIDALVSSSIWRREYNYLAESNGFSKVGPGQALLAASASWRMDQKDQLAGALWERCKLPPVKDYLSEREPYFGLAGLRSWLAAGHSVGFHTRSHPYCSRLKREDLETEFMEPAITLQRALGIQELYASYPFGDRLPLEWEDDLLNRKVFKAFLGIDGFTTKGRSRNKFERTGAEADRIGWAVLAPHLFRHLTGWIQ